MDENDSAATATNSSGSIVRKQSVQANNSDMMLNNSNLRNLNNSSKIFLNERLIALSTKSEIDNKPVSADLIESLPTEVLLSIFRNLDDLSLWSVSLTCKRWFKLISQEINQTKWLKFITNRWILFKPAVEIKCYQELYSQL